MHDYDGNTQHTKLQNPGGRYDLTGKGSTGKCGGVGGAVVFLTAPSSQVPADMILLRTTEDSGSCFIRTDQLDGETDWKLRLAVPSLQRLATSEELQSVRGSVYGKRKRSKTKRG